MTQLHSLVYVSSSARPVTDADLQHLLQRAQKRNGSCGVTGVLLFDAGNFMQYIEGPQEGLSTVYGHIRRDPLHTGIIELCNEAPAARAFEDWAMGAQMLDAAPGEGPWLVDSALEHRFKVGAVATGAAAALLQGFWHRGRRRLSRGGA